MFRYTSIIKPDYSKELEELLFFNPRQHTAHSAIMESIEMYGEPFVYNDGGRLRISTSKLGQVQTLFALHGDILAGVMLYSRVSTQRLVVIHIAANENYSSQGKYAKEMLILRISQKLRECARRIKGVETINILYGGNRTRDYPVKRENFGVLKIEVSAPRGLGKLQACDDRL
jgi:hypothetical protein